METFNDCCIFVPTCTLYKYVWDVFLALINKYWPDNPFEIYFVIDNNIDEECQNLINKLKTDKIHFIVYENNNIDNTYLNKFLFGLKIIMPKYKYVLIMCDDHFLEYNVTTNTILKCLDTLKNVSNDIICMFLTSGIFTKYLKKQPRKPIYVKCDQFPLNGDKKYTDILCPHCRKLLLYKYKDEFIKTNKQIDVGSLNYIYNANELVSHDSYNKIKFNFAHRVDIGNGLWKTNKLIELLENICSNYEDKSPIGLDTNGPDILRKLNYYTLTPEDKNVILIPQRCGSTAGIARGKYHQWTIDLLNSNNIKYTIFTDNYVYDINKIELSKHNYAKLK